MSTSHRLIDDDDLSGMIDDLKKWPHTSIDYSDFELSTTLFLTFYLSYEPAHCLQTTLAMIEVKEAFEKLLGHPFTIATHPQSERPHSYGSKRLGDIREWARLIPVEKTFSAKFTDEKNHQSSPLHSAYLWRTADWRDGGEDYSSIQFYYRWQWWLENKDAWRRFVLDTIGRLKPAQVYSGFSMGNPLEFGMRAETAVWDRALAPHFYGLDTDYPFGMSLTPQLPSGIRPPTWGFFLSDIWRNKASLSSEDVIAQLADPRIRIDALSGGHWIELGPQPELYPVEDGVPALPVLLNRLLRRIRHPQLDLVGFGEWDGDPNERFNRRDTQRWLARFDDDSDWPKPEIRGHEPGAPAVDPVPTHVVVGSTIPSEGWWYTLAQDQSRRYFKADDVAPPISQDTSRGRVIWQRDIDQRAPEPEPARRAETGQLAPRAGQWRAHEVADVLCVVAKHEPLPAYQGRPITWRWMHEAVAAPAGAAHGRSGQACPYPGTWTCQEFATGPQTFMYQTIFPQINGQDVTWVMVTFMK